MRRAPEEFVAKLQRFDPQLNVEWVPAGKPGMTEGDRWRIVRKHPDGRLRHVFYVKNPDGSYRDLDDRVLEKLHRCDAHRFYNSDQMLDWFDKNPDADTVEKLRVKKFLDDRYHDEIEELADKLAAAEKDNPHWTREEGERELARSQRKADDALAVEAAYAAGSGRIEFGPDGWPVARPE